MLIESIEAPRKKGGKNSEEVGSGRRGASLLHRRRLLKSGII